MPFDQGYGTYTWGSGGWTKKPPVAIGSTVEDRLNEETSRLQAKRAYEEASNPALQAQSREIADLNRQTSLLQARQAFKEASDPLSKQYRDEQRQYDLEELRRKRKFGEFSEQARNKILGKMGVNTSPQSPSPRYSYSSASTFP